MVKKAVLVGINYINSKYELKGCINDVKHIKDFLITNCDFEENNIKVLTEQDTILPTSDNIKSNITWLVSNNAENDLLVFHYSGHGSNIRDTNLDENDGMDETIVPLDYEKTNDITDDWLYENMTNKVQKNVNMYCFFDSCHSGTVIDLRYNYKSYCKPKRTTLNPNYDYNEWTDSFLYSVERRKDIIGNVYMFSGCQDSETSADATINNKSQGAFTCCLLETLKKNLNRSNKFKNGSLKLRHILKEINCRLDLKKFTQNTQFSSSKNNSFENTINF